MLPARFSRYVVSEFHLSQHPAMPLFFRTYGKKKVFNPLALELYI